jgi:MFS family permease
MEKMSQPETSPQPADIQAEVERNYRHNFIFNALDGATFWLGYSFIAPSIILPLYISRFTDNPFIIGLIPFFNATLFLVPQLFTSNFIERAPVKKIFPVIYGFFGERVPLFLLPITVYFFAIDRPQLALWLAIFLYAWHIFGAGVIIVGWQDMIAKVIPVDRRGRFFGITNFGGTATGILGAVAVALVLERYEFPMGYVLAFGAAAVLVLLSWFFIAQTREIPVYNSKPRVSQLTYLRSLPAIVRRDHNFSRFLVSQTVIAISNMAVGFLIVYSIRKWGLPDSYAGGYVIALQAGQSVSNLLFGFLSDKKGHKINLEISVLVGVLSMALAVVAPSPVWFYPIFFMRGVTVAAALLSGISITMEFSRPEDRPTYIGLANTIPGVVGGVAPLLGAWLAASAGYQSLFILAAVIGSAGFALLRWSVREPRFHPQAVTPTDPSAAESGSAG